jgi:hypothetical protein
MEYPEHEKEGLFGGQKRGFAFAFAFMETTEQMLRIVLSTARQGSDQGQRPASRPGPA